MTIIEAVQRSMPTATRLHHLAIRRLCWVGDRRIQWDPRRTAWIFGNAFTPDVMLSSRELNEHASQGCLTPDSLVAIDWEVGL
jgi:hypothetical protein